MTTLPDILRGFRPAGEELLRITQCVTEPYAALDLEKEGYDRIINEYGNE